MLGFGSSGTGFNAASLLPLAARLGELIAQAITRYGELRAAGLEVTPDVLAAFVLVQMIGWNPQVMGRTVLDDETRTALARFLAGVAFNLAKPRE